MHFNFGRDKNRQLEELKSQVEALKFESNPWLASVKKGATKQTAESCQIGDLEALEIKQQARVL